MGKHTAYWKAYGRSQIRGVLRIGLAIALWLMLVAATAHLHEGFGRAFPFVMGTLVAGLVITLVVMARAATRVLCPECGETYLRGRGLSRCPVCGLMLLQSDP